jgi:hypothetical protein
VFVNRNPFETNPQITVLLLFKDKNFLILGNMANLPKVKLAKKQLAESAN